MPYSVALHFDDSAGRDEVDYWLERIEQMVPAIEKTEVIRRGEYMDAEKISDDELGRQVRFDLPDGGEVVGTLEAYYPAGRHEVSRALIVNGTAHVLTYGTVHVAGD